MKVLPIFLCAIYMILTIAAPAWAFWAVVGILISLALYLFLVIANYGIAMTLKCDGCGRPSTIGAKKKRPVAEEINSATRKMNTPIVPVQWKVKAFRCVHCGAEFTLA